MKEELPISEGFYNWRNFELNNIEFIKKMIYKPLKDIDDLAEEVYWCEEWGEEPISTEDKAKSVRTRLKMHPSYCPFFHTDIYL